MTILLSDHLKVTRNRLAEHRHGGLVLTGEDLEDFIRRMTSFVTMSIELEQKLLQAGVKVGALDCRPPSVIYSDTVVPFQPPRRRPRLTLVTGHDGGDAA